MPKKVKGVSIHLNIQENSYDLENLLQAAVTDEVAATGAMSRRYCF